MGAHVVITEVDPLRALEALMDGYAVKPMLEAAAEGDIFVTATGDVNVLDRQHFEVMRDGAILANSGHFNVEINIPALAELSTEVRAPRPYIQQYVLSDGRAINVLGEGRLINLAAAEGHPASVMDMSFANQALSVEYLVRHAHELDDRVHSVPASIDRRVAELKLAAVGIEIDSLTDEQARYLASWEQGT
jgi:adenosylhomocysteinase